jgi:hypothetical protein
MLIMEVLTLWLSKKVIEGSLFISDVSGKKHAQSIISNLNSYNRISKPLNWIARWYQQLE